MNLSKWNIWVYLARFYSGLLNAGMLLSINTMLTLHTGNTTRISIFLVNREWDLIVFPAIALLSYFAASFLTSGYFGEKTKILAKDYWKGYFLIGILFLVLWALPTGSWVFIVTISAAMGVMCSMPLRNNDYTGTITMVTGLITELANQLSIWFFRKSDTAKKQSGYLALNLLFYVLGVMSQAILYNYLGIVRALLLALFAFLLAYWAYQYGREEIIPL